MWGERGRPWRRQITRTKTSCDSCHASAAENACASVRRAFRLCGFVPRFVRGAFRDVPCRRPGLETRLAGLRFTSGDATSRLASAIACAPHTSLSLRSEQTPSTRSGSHCREARHRHRLTDQGAPLLLDVPPTPPHRHTRGDDPRARNSEGGRARHFRERRRARLAAPRAPQRASAPERAQEPHRGCDARPVRPVRLRSGR